MANFLENPTILSVLGVIITVILIVVMAMIALNYKPRWPRRKRGP